MSDEIICGVNVRILKEQCERLAEPIRASTRSFQYASALDNCVAVINELQARLSAFTPPPSPRAETTPSTKGSPDAD